MLRTRFRTAVLAALLAVFVQPSSTRADEPEAAPIRPARERLVEYWLIGGTVRDTSRRDVGRHQIGDAGWPAFVRDRVRPSYDWGMRRFWVHNPFGTVGGAMNFTQYLEAREAGLDFLTKDFGSAWRPVVDGALGEPTELVAYIGPANFEDGGRLQQLHEQGNVARTLAFMMKCVQPLLEAGASIGADASARLDDDGPTIRFYEFLQSLGMDVYIESRPRKDRPRWAQFNVVAEDQWWHRSDPERHADASWALPESEYQRSVVRIFHDYEGGSSDPSVVEPLIQRIRAALLEGHTVAFRSDGLRRAGIPMSRLTDGIDEALGVTGGTSRELEVKVKPSTPEADATPDVPERRIRRSLENPGPGNDAASPYKRIRNVRRSVSEDP